VSRPREHQRQFSSLTGENTRHHQNPPQPEFDAGFESPLVSTVTEEAEQQLEIGVGDGPSIWIYVFGGVTDGGRAPVRWAASATSLMTRPLTLPLAKHTTGRDVRDGTLSLMELIEQRQPRGGTRSPTTSGVDTRPWHPEHVGEHGQVEERPHGHGDPDQDREHDRHHRQAGGADEEGQRIQ
jgi:hypothetical protein